MIHNKVPRASAKTHEFLYFMYNTIETKQEIGFLINKDQVYTGFFLSKPLPVKSPYPCLNTIAEYNNTHVLVFNIDKYVKNMFSLEHRQDIDLALVIDTSFFSVKNKKLMQKITIKGGKHITADFIAVRLGITADIVNLSLTEIKMFPKNNKDKLNKEGFLGCRFPSPQGINYFIDLEKIVFNTLVKPENRL